jgi:hypothetical protein
MALSPRTIAVVATGLLFLCAGCTRSGNAEMFDSLAQVSTPSVQTKKRLRAKRPRRVQVERYPTVRAPSIESAISPQGSNLEMLEHDIAIVTLAEAMRSRRVPVVKRYVKLPRQGTAATTGIPMIAMGWGRTAEKENPASVLQEISVPVTDHQACRTRYSNPAPPFPPFHVRDAMLCASAPGKDSCQGDRGGPLVVAHSDGSFTQLGITSYGNGCARTIPASIRASAHTQTGSNRTCSDCLS